MIKMYQSLRPEQILILQQSLWCKKEQE